MKGFSNDDSHGGEISISNGDYAKGLAEITAALGSKLDIVGFDACLMGMWEIADATAPYANYLVASSETEPGPGWAYHRFLPQLIANYNQTPLELGTAIVDGYYAESTDNATLAVTDLQTMTDLNAKVTGFANTLMAHTDLYASIKTVVDDTQGFYLWEHKDLYDFADRIAVMADAPADLIAAANQLKTQLDVSIKYNKAQADYAGAHGLAIYLPTDSMDGAYKDIGAVWSQHTTWDEFLAGFSQ